MTEMIQAGDSALSRAVSEAKVVLCPYCGAGSTGVRCGACGGLFEPLSMQATQNEMGPWFLRDEANPFRPGCSYRTLRRLAESGRLSPLTIIRGPTTRQFWSLARNTRGVAHLLGECHNCHGAANKDEYMCRHCGVVLEAPRDRQHFGAGPVRMIPGRTPPEVMTRSTVDGPRHAWESASTLRASAGLAPARNVSSTAAADEHASTGAHRIRQELARARSTITISVAVNVVLLAALVVVIAVFIRRASSAGQTSSEIDSATAVLPTGDETTVTESGPSAAELDMAAKMAHAQSLADSDAPADLRAAEQLLESLLTDATVDSRPAAAELLLGRVRRKLDAITLDQFLTTPPSRP